MISFQKIADITQGKCLGHCRGEIKYLLTDSRKFSLPNEVVFFAISGDFHDGHQFIPDLIKKGITRFVVSKNPDSEWLKNAGFIVVDDVVDALQKTAAWWRSLFTLPVVGITGSNGKTIVKEWIAQCIGEDVRLTRSPASYNSQIGVPLAVWMLGKEAELALFEAGISQPGEMQKLQKVIQPNIGLFTNIGDAHQENFKSFEQKLQEKLNLFKDARTIIFRDEGNWISEQIKTRFTPQRCFTWSFAVEADVKVSHEADQLVITASSGSLIIKQPFPDKASVENLMHTISLLFYLGYSAAYIQKAVKRIKGIPMRLEQKAGKKQNTIINDSYNSDLGSLSNALDFLAQQKQHNRRILFLSDIYQSGYMKENLYKEVAVLVNAHQPDFMIGVGTHLSHYRQLFHVPSKFYNNTREVIESLDELPLENSTILLKGSRPYHFEKIDQALEEKSHRTVLEVNLNTLTSNLNYFKSLLAPETGIIVMVKAFSYGSGSHEIANVLQYNRVAYLAVAYADEGVELRKRGIELPIMVMNPYMTDFENIIQFRLEPVIFDFHILRKFGEFLLQHGERRFPVHIKLNTGMNRSGFDLLETGTLNQWLDNFSVFYVKTAFTHLAATDEAVHDEFTGQQVQLYMKMVSQIEQSLNYKISKHVLNSAGIERFPNYQFDYVRLGIGLYGVTVNSGDVEQIGRLKTRIAQVREVQAGETIGYGRKGMVETPKTIATIPIGYADGFRRALSKGVGKVWINGQLYPVVGNVCMDMTMIDITNSDVEVGDQVVIFGPELSIETVAEWLDTIPYEILTNVAARVKRIYIKE